jgi:drug/metabolite transporter (DMT)-like permease
VLPVVPNERVTRARVGGLPVGFAGVFVVLGAWRGVAVDVVEGGLACLPATTCYGAGSAHARRFSPGDDCSPSRFRAGIPVCQNLA